MELPKQINNINERVVDDLKIKLSSNSRICVAAASFSIYAFEALKKELDTEKHQHSRTANAKGEATEKTI